MNTYIDEALDLGAVIAEKWAGDLRVVMPTEDDAEVYAEIVAMHDDVESVSVYRAAVRVEFKVV